MSDALPRNLTDAAVRVLDSSAPEDKVALTARFADAWAVGAIVEIGSAQPPDRPARPSLPELRMPKDMPKRRKGRAAGRLAFLHAIAHIEFNAIDLAWDIVARFTHEHMPKEFYDDWVRVADDEARHFTMLDKRMEVLGGRYGDLPAHDGLWQAAKSTSDDLMARLALIPMVLEARGLDTTPDAVKRLREGGDGESADILETIGLEEEPHVAAGVRWFKHLADIRKLNPEPTFHTLVRTRFTGQIKPPFNTVARARAGMTSGYYQPLAT